jgi:hypothetical protein
LELKAKMKLWRCKQDIWDQVLVALFFTCKIYKIQISKLLTFFNISNQMELLDFLTNTFSLPLVSFSKTIVQKIVIWTWKNTPKVSPKIMLIFEGCG